MEQVSGSEADQGVAGSGDGGVAPAHFAAAVRSAAPLWRSAPSGHGI